MTDTGRPVAILRRDQRKPVQILLVEDSPSDAAMTIEALRESRIENQVHVAQDGEVAMGFLRRQGCHRDAPPIDLILLDLNLPRMDGREVLEAVKSDEDLEMIPVIVLTSSSAEADILGSYKLHANAFVTKPVGLEQFLAAIATIENFWLSLVRLPR